MTGEQKWTRYKYIVQVVIGEQRGEAVRYSVHLPVVTLSHATAAAEQCMLAAPAAGSLQKAGIRPIAQQSSDYDLTLNELSVPKPTNT